MALACCAGRARFFVCILCAHHAGEDARCVQESHERPLPQIEPPRAREDAPTLASTISPSVVPSTAPSTSGDAPKASAAATAANQPAPAAAAAEQCQPKPSAKAAANGAKEEIDAQRELVSPSLPWSKRPPLPEAALDARKVSGQSVAEREAPVCLFVCAWCCGAAARNGMCAGERQANMGRPRGRNGQGAAACAE